MKVRAHQKQIGSASGMNNKGFTLIEILVAIAIIVIMATVLVPNIGRRIPGYERKRMLSQLNALTRFAWHNAVIAHKLHRVVFNIGKNRVHLEVEQDAKDEKGEPLFKPLKQAYISSSMTWPDRFQIKNFFIEGFDEMRRFGGGRVTTETWFFVVPEGLTQEVTINMIDLKDVVDGKPKQISLVLNPFTAQFKVYE